MPIDPAFRRLMQEDPEFEVILGYILRPSEMRLGCGSSGRAPA
jgi:hypothetical protein